MAITYINLLEPNLRYSYDEASMIYTISMGFLAEIGETGDPLAVSKDLADVIEDSASGTYTAANWEGGASNSDIPATVEITYSGNLSATGASTQTVYCDLANIDVTNTTTENQVQIDVVYMGRVTGVHSATPRTQMQSVRQPHSLDTDDEGDRIGIGPDFEGVARHMPVSIIQIKEVLPTTSAIPGRIDDTKEQGGSVNESNWIAPWGTTYSEGTWVYMGIVGSSYDRRTATVEIIHEIMQQGDRENQQDHRWFNYVREEGLDNRIKLKYDATPTTAQFLPIAGTDQHWDEGTVIGTWSSTINFDELWE